MTEEVIVPPVEQEVKVVAVEQPPIRTATPVQEFNNEQVVIVESSPDPLAKSKNEVQVEPKASKLVSKGKVVHTSALVFNSNARNSVSVGLVQERLVELGHADAGSDKYGWLSEGTMKSLAEFAKTSVEKCNPQDATMISKLFAGTSVEVVK